MRRRAGPLETVSVVVPEDALELFEAALLEYCETVSFFLADEDKKTWQVEGVRDVPEDDAALRDALALAAMATGVPFELVRTPTEADGWLARTQEAFPDQLVGRRFLVRGTHSDKVVPGRHTLELDAGLAFGSGEHGSTRGCLRALEIAARRRPRRVLDLGTGSGILAMAAAKLLNVRVLATDIEPWSVRVARENAWRNGVGRAVRVELADGWRSSVIVRAAPFDLVLANILARPLCRMAGHLASRLAPGGGVILAGLLIEQVRTVLAAHQRHGLRLERILTEGNWATLMLRAGG